MLNAKERMVMGEVYELCAGTQKGACLVRPVELLKRIPYRKEFNARDLQEVLNTLQLDDYFELVESDAKGEPVYCITMHAKGEAFKRSVTVLKRTIGFKIAMAVGSAGVTFAVSMLLKWLVTL